MDLLLSFNTRLHSSEAKSCVRCSLVALAFISVAMISTFICFASFAKNGYELLFLLPISFILLILVNISNFEERIRNFGFLLVVSFEFIRLVLVPVLFVLGNYPATITFRSDSNAPIGILLTLYETLWITVALKRVVCVKETKHVIFKTKRLILMLIILSLLTLIICLLAPEILANYRTIFQLGEDEFTTIEQGYIVNLYSGSFVKKLFLVLANYWLKPMRLVLPAIAMVIIKRLFKKLSKIVCLVLALTPLFFVDGTVARSLYFTIILILFYNKLFGITIKYMLYLMLAAFIFVVFYWYIRFSLDPSNNSFISSLAEKFNDYFSGFNVVSGYANLPFDFGSSLKYFFDDFIHAIPFSNTLFGLDSADTSRTFFNEFNHTSGGQVAATIAMSSYYLTPFLGPIFSYFFVRISVSSGDRAIRCKNPLSIVPLYLTALYFALGIAVNDIGVTLGNYVQVVLVVFLAIRLCGTRIKQKE